MTIENAVRILAGSMSLLGLAIFHFVSPWGLLLVAFVGLNLIQSAFTGFCPASFVFGRLGLTDGASCRNPHAT